MDHLIAQLLDCGTCSRCGAPDLYTHTALVCGAFAERRELWADGWIDLASFGLSTPSVAKRWPEHHDGPRFEIRYDGFGHPWPSAIPGPWVRGPEVDGVTALRRAAALVTVIRLRPRLNRWEAVPAVLAAPPAAIDAVLRPDGYVARTTGCGEAHRVRIVHGRPVLLDHDPAVSEQNCEWPGSSSLDPADPMGSVAALSHLGGLLVADTTLTCDDVRSRWVAGSFGEVHLDLHAPPGKQHRTVGRDRGLVDAVAPIVVAFKSRLRLALIESRAADHWLELNVQIVAEGEKQEALQGNLGPQCLIVTPAQAMAV